MKPGTLSAASGKKNLDVSRSTTTGMFALDALHPHMELADALTRKRLHLLTPYKVGTWAILNHADCSDTKYIDTLLAGLQNGFIVRFP